MESLAEVLGSLNLLYPSLTMSPRLPKCSAARGKKPLELAALTQRLANWVRLVRCTESMII